MIGCFVRLTNVPTDKGYSAKKILRTDKDQHAIENNFGFLKDDQIGKRVQQEGHPGLLAASARDPLGINLAAFNPDVLGNPRQHCYLNYHYNPHVPSITVQREQGKNYLEICY